MEREKTRRRIRVVLNYLFLLIMNVCFYLVSEKVDMTHMVDAVGIGALVLVAITFRRLHKKTGLWKLTHAKTDQLDERQVQITHRALSQSYGWFTVICLVIMLVHAVLYRLVPGLNFVITVPLVGSLIYLAHTLPGSILAWTETEVPGEAQ
jgi:peptidoglycan/LPS O-acetylase OafA/YrhL